MAVNHCIVCIHYLASHQWFHQCFIFVKNLWLYPRFCGHTIHPLPCFIPMVSPMSRRLHKTMAVDHGIVCIHYLASHQWFYHHFFKSISMVHSHGYWRTLDHASHRRFVRVVLYAFITWLHTNGFTNGFKSLSKLWKNIGYFTCFVEIQSITYHASHKWFHQCPEDSTKPWLWTMVLYASIPGFSPMVLPSLFYVNLLGPHPWFLTLTGPCLTPRVCQSVYMNF